MDFNFTTQISTTKEQSERLLTLGLKKETSDMCLDNMGNIYIYPSTIIEVIKNDWSLIPLWSLHRLIEMIPTTVPDKSGITHFFAIDGSIDVSYYFFGEEDWDVWKTWNKKELYDNVIDCIEWLIKEGHFNKDYLKE